MSGRIRELTSKYFLVNRKKGGEGSLSTSFFFTTTWVMLASSSARPISNQCIWVWLQQGQPGVMVDSVTQTGKQQQQTQGMAKEDNAGNTA